MELLAYGEDALTLWAIRNRLGEILVALDDASDPGGCLAYYRPSFGRGGGPANFGEFDALLLSEKAVHLIESKWDRLTGQVDRRVFHLRPEQLRRHRLMRFYIEAWAYGEHADWEAFGKTAPEQLKKLGIDKPIAPAGSDLFLALNQVLGAIRARFPECPAIRDVFLYFHRGADPTAIPDQTRDGFQVVAMDPASDLAGRFVRLG